MLNEEIEFTITGKDGKEIVCKILMLLPRDDVESYIVFVDDNYLDNDGNVNLQYGRLIQCNDDYEIKAGITDIELDYIRKEFNKELESLAHSILESK